MARCCLFYILVIWSIITIHAAAALYTCIQICTKHACDHLNKKFFFQAGQHAEPKHTQSFVFSAVQYFRTGCVPFLLVPLHHLQFLGINNLDPRKLIVTSFVEDIYLCVCNREKLLSEKKTRNSIIVFIGGDRFVDFFLIIQHCAHALPPSSYIFSYLYYIMMNYFFLLHCLEMIQNILCTV